MPTDPKRLNDLAHSETARLAWEMISTLHLVHQAVLRGQTKLAKGKVAHLGNDLKYLRAATVALDARDPLEAIQYASRSVDIVEEARHVG